MIERFNDGQKYAAHRPNYPDELFPLLADLVSSPKGMAALDIGCGTGQLTAPLAKHFGQVVGIDTSQSQLDAAKPAKNIEYKQGSAEEIPLPDDSVNLVTVGQAAHWLDLDKFYPEVRRVGKLGSALALVSYGVCEFPDDPAVDRAYQEFYWGDFHRFWEPQRGFVEKQLKTLDFPFDRIAVECPPIERFYSFPEFMGYIHTWSAAKTARETGYREELDRFAVKLGSVWGDPDVRRKVVWPVTVLAGLIASHG